MTRSRTGRRDFLKVAVGSMAAMTAAGWLKRALAQRTEPWPPHVAEETPRPNILWISAEDISPTLRCYGDEYAVTPNLDQFATEGIRYDRAFAHAPVCAPARSGLITGMYPTSIGTTWMRCQGVPLVEARCFTEYLRAAGYYCINNAKTDYQFQPPGSAWDESSRSAHWRNRADKSQPFFAVFNYGMTHESQTRNFKAGATHNPKAAKGEKAYKNQNAFDHDPAKAPLPPYYPDTPLVRQNLACYYDRMSQLDKQFKVMMDQLEQDGLAENTIVWFWGDHGWGLTRGKRFLFESGLRVPLIVRVPQKYRNWAGGGDPATVKPGRVEGEMVSFIDFAPTMLSLAGATIPDHMQGQAFLGPQKADRPHEYIFGARDRMDECYDFQRTVRDKKYRYIRNYTPYLTLSQPIDYMDRTPILREMRRLHAEGKLADGPQMQFFQPEKPVRELYDVEADPHNIRNLAADPKYAEVVQRMQKALDEWMIQIGDIGFMPESFFDSIKGGGKTAAPGLTPKAAKAGKLEHIEIACPTKGSSIEYRIQDAAEKPKAKSNRRRPKHEKGWLLYKGPVELKPGQKIAARAFRIGYAASGVAEYVYGGQAVAPGKADDPETFWRERIDNSGALDLCMRIKAYDGRWGEGVRTYLLYLGHELPPVRYWSAIGLNQAARSDPAVAKRVLASIARRAEDPDPAVRAAVGEALCTMGKMDDGLNVLAEVATGKTGMAACLAAWALWRLGEKARPVLAKIQDTEYPKERYPKAALARVVKMLKKD